MRWEKVEGKAMGTEGGGGGIEVYGPGKRWGHTCNAVKGGRLVYVFGGYGKDNCQTNQVHVFDTVKQTWSQPIVKGSPPTPRDSHTCTAIGDNLFVFGGTDGMNPLKDLHILDTSLHTWVSPTIRGEGPPAREGHSAAVVGKRLFIFGGCGKSADSNNEVYYNDLYILNTETFVWKCATTSGTPPSPRDSHSCSSWKNKIIVIGGEDGHDYYLSDVHILDTDTLIWRELSTSGQLLPPRAGHSTVSFGKNLFIFGGFTDAQNLYNDLYMLDIGIARESEQRPEKLSLRKQLKLKCQEQNPNPSQNQVLARYGVGSDMGQIMSVLNYSQQSRLNIPVNQSLPPGKKMFEAKVTENISEGYTIETVIDGKPLRGILFLNKPNSLYSSAHTPSSRKRTLSEIDSVVLNGIHSNQLKTPKVLKQNQMENQEAFCGDSSESHEHRTESIAVVMSSNPVTADASDTHKVSANQEPEAAALNQNDEKHETPISLSENLKKDGANDVICSRDEVQTNDQTNVPISNFELTRHDTKFDAPNYNAEFQKPAASESVLCLSNQGIFSEVGFQTGLDREQTFPA
ncbi:tip elongation aberrant protein 1 isoform X8 [Vigna angularis]|uniref:tip elongation aberrant protein 1 isoform X8 n=1 Tax=Phaseolus angularis TaxID=3914 RepID=UPI0022B4449E|nr:tip elongation aberrant protein 1 isoform X8 [Vigna angularis]